MSRSKSLISFEDTNQLEKESAGLLQINEKIETFKQNKA